MKLAGLLLLPAGWLLVLAALCLLTSEPARTGFAVAGFGVELLGLGLLARSQMLLQEEQD